MTWLRLSISSHREYLDELKDLLEKFESASISYTPYSPEAVFDDQSEKARLWEITTLTALLDPAVDLDILLACIRNRIGTENIIEHHIDVLKDEDWEATYKTSINPIIINDTLCIYPSWTSAPANVACAIELDPGLAFGTGTHETTSLCLEWLTDNSITGKRIIDYGCGSGILGIAAAKLGAETVVSIDIDAQALSATRKNAEINGVMANIRVLNGEKPFKDSADILIANILLEPLLFLSNSFNSYLSNKGVIVLSGLLANQVEVCLDCYSEWFDMSMPTYKNEWAMLTGVKKDDLL
jgi:ribosomal protein L11 methyltransferase